MSPVSPALTGGFFTSSATWEAYSACYLALKSQIPLCLFKVAVPQSLCQICDLLSGKSVPLGVPFFFF